MEIKNIDIIIRNVLLNQASKEEQLQFDNWLEASDLNKRVFDQLKEVWQAEDNPKKSINEEEIIDHIWDDNQQNCYTSKSNSSKKLWKQLAKVAASIVLIAACFFLISKNYAPEPKAEVKIQQIDKRNISGQKSRIHLSDGTVVWLNAESTLSYVKPFAKDRREVRLEGEGYFEVAKDTDRPFVVKMRDTEVEVLGTKFNISSFEKDEKEVIALSEGKIQITRGTVSQILTPGWIAEIDNNTSQLESYKGNVMDKMAWTEGILLFKNASYQEIFRTLEKWYGVHIHTEGIPDKQLKFNGSFQNEYLSNVLENLVIEHKMAYEIIGENVIIKFN